MSELTNLEILYLNNNELSDWIPWQLGNGLLKLQRLRLDNNQFSGEMPFELGTLPAMVLLNLSNNELSGELSSGMVEYMTSLTTLVFHSNSGLCAPTTTEFQTWLGRVATVEGSSCSASDHAGDRAALVSLYTATDGANWVTKTNWNSDELIRTWHGVTTDKNGRVTGLFLSRNQLNGPIPPPLGRLAELRYLYLDENDLTGEIPRQLGGLPPVLTGLRLAGNQLIGCVPTRLQEVPDNDFDALGLLLCIFLETGSTTTIEITGASVDNDFEFVNRADQSIVYISIPSSAVETGATLTVRIPDAPAPPPNFTLPAVPHYVEMNLDRTPTSPVTVCLPRISGVEGEQRVFHLTDGASEWTVLAEPDPYPGAYPDSHFVCGIATEFSTFVVGVLTPRLGTAMILRIEPSIRSATVSARDRIRLSVDVYGRQNILDNRLADGIEFEWDAGANGNFHGDGREVIYTAPDSPGRYTVMVSFANRSDCEAAREGSKCSAEFEVRVRRPSVPPTPAPAPINPPGDIPEYLADEAGNQYTVFTPEEGGMFDGDSVSITAGPGVVHNGDVIGVSMSRGEPASNTGQAHHRYTLAGDTYHVMAVDALKQRISDYSLASPAQVCIPLPDALRSNIPDVAIAMTDGSGSLTILSSSVRITSGGTALCSYLGRLPATIAAAKVGAPPDFPMPTPEPEEALPDTGGSVPGSSSGMLWMILAGIAAAMIGATVIRARSLRYS